MHGIVGDVKDRWCLMVDDMIDTGGTISKAAEALKEAGARGVTIAATHAIFSGQATTHLSADFIDQVVVTDTLPVPEEKRFDKLTVLSIAPLLAKGDR